jgi:hypothetical protein
MTGDRIRLLFGAALIAGVLAGAPGAAAAEAKDAEKDNALRKAGRRVRLGGVIAGAGYAHSTGYAGFWPYSSWSRWPGYWYSPFYDPWWGGGFFHPGYFTGFGRAPGMGEVRIREAAKDSEVYLDGAYAGTAGKLKSAGAYNLELCADQDSYSKRIYVLSGKRLEIRPKFARDKESKP